MSARISLDERQPTATMEWVILQPLSDFDLEEVEAHVPRDVDPMLASQGFKDLLDEVRELLEQEFRGSRIVIAQLTGAICGDGEKYHPGIWAVVSESGDPGSRGISAGAREHLHRAAEVVRTRLGLA